MIGARSTQSQNEDFTSLLTDFRPQNTFDYHRMENEFGHDITDLSPSSFEHFLSKGSLQESSPTRASKSSKIAELEKQIAMLKQQLTLEKSLHDEGSQMSMERVLIREESATISITDFTPEWDYLEGGSKMIICFNLNRVLTQQGKVTVCFGDNLVDGSWVQHNVVKCFGRRVLISALGHLRRQNPAHPQIRRSGQAGAYGQLLLRVPEEPGKEGAQAVRDDRGRRRDHR